MPAATIPSGPVPQVTDLLTRFAGEEAQALQRAETAYGVADTARQHAKDVTQEGLSKLDTLTNAPLPVQEHAQFPQEPSKQIVDPKEYEGLSFALLGLALIGGVASHGDWLGVSSTLNGALQGFYEGNRQKADEAWKRYNAEFKAAEAKEKQLNEKYLKLLEDRKLTINEQLKRVELEARIAGDEAVAAAARAGNFTKLYEVLAGKSTALATAAQRSHDVVVRVEAQREARAASSGGGNKNAPQTEAGRELAAQLMNLGVPVSFWGGKGQIYDKMAADGMTAQGVASNKAQLTSLTAATRATELRRAGVERLTGTVQALESGIIDIGKKYGLTGSSLLNAPMNYIRSKLGDADLAELRTLIVAANRSYVEAVTMPGSNAQLHTGHAEVADKILNDTMSVGQMLGSFKGMNTDIEAGHLSLGATAKRLNSQIMSLGGLNPDMQTGAKPSPTGAAPYSDAAKEQRYQEWKRQHAGGQ